MGAGCGYYLVTPSAYPTHIRCTAHSFINLFGRAGCGYYLVTPSAYPTHIRCTAHSFINLFGRAGGFFATLAGTAPFNLQLGLYTVANAVCAFITMADYDNMKAEEALEVLAEDLSSSHIEKQKTRSFHSNNGSFNQGKVASENLLRERAKSGIA